MATCKVLLLIVLCLQQGITGHLDSADNTDTSGKTYSFIIEMINQAGKIGEPIGLFTRSQKNQSDVNSEYVSWEYYPEGSAVTIWGENNPDDILDPIKFSHTLTDVDNDQYDYNLTVVADPSVSGPYRAKFILDANVYTQAEVVILDNLGCPPEGQVKEETEEVTISCDTYFYGYKNPVMRWFTDYGEVPGNVITVDEENNHVMATVNITAGPEHDLLTFRCQLAFEMDEGETSAPPTYEDECTTYYFVNYAVSDIEIDPNPDDVPGGVLDMCLDQVISCSASGRPEPTYVWFCDEDQIIVEGQDLLVTEVFVRPNNEPVECRCVAENVVNGQPRQATKQVDFVAYASAKCYTFLVELVNIAGKIGDSINLYTRAKKDASNIDSAYVGWKYFPGEVVQIWAEQIPDEIVDPSKFAHIYTDLGNNIYEYNLTLYADTTLSGPYQASFLLDGDVKTIADVVIVDTLGCPPEAQVKEENQQFILSCESYYYGYKNPTLRWYTQDAEVNSTLHVVDNRVIATVNMTAAPKHDKLTFYCRLEFETTESEAAAPVYEDECTTFYHIIHAVTNITISPNPDNAPGGVLELEVGSFLNCSASGRPEPSYSWTCDDGQFIQGQSLLITESFIREETVLCTCEAKNVVNGRSNIVQEDVKFVVSYAVKDVELQPNPDDAPGGILQMEVGEFINCSADGLPEPTYSWNCNNGQTIQGPNLQVTDSFIREDNTPYTCECQAQNTINGQPRTAQKNATFLVYYGVVNMTIQPNPDDAPDGILQMTVGEFINCSADGRPEPNYNWTCDDGQVIPGPNLPMTESFIREGNRTVMCTCIAQNVVKGQENTAEKQVYFVVNGFIGCTVWKTSSESIDINETVIFEGILFNEGNNYDQLTGEFRCPVSGAYYITVTGKVDNTEDILLAITRNGERIVDIYERNSHPYNTMTNSCVMRCEAGDVIEVTGHYDTSYVYGDTSVVYTSLTVMLMHADGDTEQSFEALTSWKSRRQDVNEGDIVTFPEIIYDSPNYMPLTSTYTCSENGIYFLTLNVLKFGDYVLNIFVEHKSNTVLSVADILSYNRYNQVSNSVLLQCSPDDKIAVKAAGPGSVYGENDFVWTTLTVILMNSQDYNTFFVGCSLWKTSSQAYSKDDTIQYDGIAVNIGGHFDPSTSQFVCPDEAVYYVTATAKKSSVFDLQINIMHESTTLFRLEVLGSDNRENTVSNSALVHCIMGEVIQVKAEGSGSIYGSPDGIFSTLNIIKMK